MCSALAVASELKAWRDDRPMQCMKLMAAWPWGAAWREMGERMHGWALARGPGSSSPARKGHDHAKSRAAEYASPPPCMAHLTVVRGPATPPHPIPLPHGPSCAWLTGRPRPSTHTHSPCHVPCHAMPCQWLSPGMPRLTGAPPLPPSSTNPVAHLTGAPGPAPSQNGCHA